MTIGKSDEFPGWIALFPVLGAAAIIIAGPGAWINRAILGSKGLVYIGLLSFPLYLWHWPVLVYLRMAVGERPSGAYQFVAVCLSLALAWVTYLAVEQPIRHAATKGKSALITWLLLGTAFVLAAVGAGGAYGIFDNLRPASLKANSANFSWEGLLENKNCRTRFPELTADFCNLAENRDPTVALIGDSHALVYYPGLAPELASRGDNLLNLGGPSCMPVFSAPFHSTGYPINPNVGCTEALDQAYDLIDRTPSIHTVILSARRFVRALTPLEQEKGRLALDASVRRLKAAGKKIIYVLDFPEARIEPSACVRPFALVNRQVDCWINRSQATAARQTQENMIRSVAVSHSELIIHDPFVDLCEGSNCPIVVGNRSLYRDRDHLSLDGSLLGARSLARLIQRQ